MTDRPDEGNDTPSEPPGYGEPSQPPAYGDPNQPPAYGNPNQPPAYGYPGQQPGGGYPPPGYGGQQPTYPGQPMPGQAQGYPPPPTSYGSPDPQAYLGAPVYPGYPGGEDPNARRGFSGFAIAAFVTGLVVPLLGLFAAVPLGIIALVRISKTRAKGRWMAITGMVLGVLWWVGIIGLGIWAISNQAQRNDAGVITESGDIDFTDVRVGDCITIDGLSGDGSIDTLKGVPCTEQHNAQAYWIVTLDGSDYPGESAIAQQGRQGCESRYATYAASGSQPYYLYPTEGMWGSSDGHRVVCFVIHEDRQPWTGSVVK